MRSIRNAAPGFILLLLTQCIQSQNAAAPPGCTTPVDVLTHRNNNSRTGANLCETALTPDNVNAKTFGNVFSFKVMGQVYAQPLIATQVPEILVNARGTTERNRNVAIVATMENFVYAFDADGRNKDANGVPQPYWSVHLGNPLPVNRIPRDIGAFLGHFNIYPYVGITSTPVIDPEKTTIFLVAKIAVSTPGEMYCDGEVATKNCPVVNRIVALNLATGAVRDSKDISLLPPEESQTGDSAGLHPCGPLDNRKPTVDDAGRINMQRPALLLTGSSDQRHIYLGFGSHQDAPCPMYHGMVLRFDFENDKLKQFPQTFMVSQIGDLGSKDATHPNDPRRLGMGGVWQAGNGPVADEAGNVYFMTGNGGFDPGKRFGSNFVKLNPDMQPVDWFAPWNAWFLNDGDRDIDLGASGPVLLPGSGQIVGGGKQGKLYLLDRQALGKQQKFGWPKERTHPPVQVFWAARRWAARILLQLAPHQPVCICHRLSSHPRRTGLLGRTRCRRRAARRLSLCLAGTRSSEVICISKGVRCPARQVRYFAQKERPHRGDGHAGRFSLHIRESRGARRNERPRHSLGRAPRTRRRVGRCRSRRLARV